MVDMEAASITPVACRLVNFDVDLHKLITGACEPDVDLQDLTRGASETDAPLRKPKSLK